MSREAPRGGRGGHAVGEVAADGVVTHRPMEALLADRGDLVGAQRRVLRLQVEDGLTNFSRQRTAIAGRRCCCLEEARHPRGGEAVGLAAEGALGHAGLAGTRRRGTTKEDDRT